MIPEVLEDLPHLYDLLLWSSLGAASIYALKVRVRVRFTGARVRRNARVRRDVRIRRDVRVRVTRVRVGDLRRERKMGMFSKEPGGWWW